MFIDEVIKLYPPVPISVERLLKMINGKAIKCQRYAYYNKSLRCPPSPKYWEDPLKFEPERHLKEKMKEMPRFSYFPYGGGPRTCIGMGYAQIQLPLTVAFLVKILNLMKKLTQIIWS